jgi:hypothetical protein
MGWLSDGGERWREGERERYNRGDKKESEKVRRRKREEGR